MMRNQALWSWVERYGWLLLILLLAAVLRFHDLAGIPPGLTHDEADHGLTAWQIANDGLREIYFTIGYGREPLYDYAMAAVMSFLGPSILAGRLVSAFASLILIAAMMAWVSQAFNRSTALMTGAGLAFGFWPVMSGRQALRSILLPTLFVLAVLVFWLAFRNVISATGPTKKTRFWRGFHRLLPFIAAGIFLGLTFYTYIPARALWIIFPALLLYWLFKQRDFVPVMWWRIGVMLLVMFFIAAPLLLHLLANPAAETRIRQLAEPLYAAQEGDWELLTGQAWDSLRLFFVEGDPTWRYNIAGRPFLTPLFGILFILGLLQALWWIVTGKESADKLLGSASFLSLSWLIVGFAPVLITGPALSMTQAIAVQPLIYLFPAVALAAGGAWVARWAGNAPRYLYTAGVVLLFTTLALVTWRDYFQTWANHPEVRVQYETTMATAIDHLNTHGRGEAAISTITPGRYHSPALAEMTLDNEDVTLRWLDGRGSLLLPREESATMVVPGFTPLPLALDRYFDSAELVETLPLRESDLDRPLRFYALNRVELLDDWRERLTPAEAQFGDTIDLTGFELMPQEASPGEEVSLVTFWQARQSLEEAVFFTHVLGADGVPLAQTDRLDVPGYSWAPGDSFLQLHQLALPADMAAGEYQIAVGVYSLPDNLRLSLTGESSTVDLFPITSLTVVP
jgi:hypothetical protein